MRAELRLRSASFTITWTEKHLFEITTRGYGHGVGPVSYTHLGDALRAKPDENSGVRWFMLDEAVEASPEEWMRTRVYEKLNRKVRALG